MDIRCRVENYDQEGLWQEIQKSEMIFIDK